MLRSAPTLLTASVSGFALCFSFLGGCSIFGGDDGSGGTSPTGSGGSAGAAGEGGAAGSGTSSSSSSGMPVECTDHTTLDETNCSLLKQDCKSEGEVCVPAGTVTQCVYETGIKGVGASCSDNKECSAGLMCVFYVCAPICCQSQSQAFCGSGKCNVNINLGSKSVWACNFAKSCTLFGNDCPENQQCRLGDPQQELALCAPASDMPSPEGGPCEYLNDCGANQICSGKVCRYSCSLADWQSKDPGEGGCPKGPPAQTCNAVSPNFGVCAL